MIVKGKKIQASVWSVQNHSETHLFLCFSLCFFFRKIRLNMLMIKGWLRALKEPSRNRSDVYNPSKPEKPDGILWHDGAPLPLQAEDWEMWEQPWKITIEIVDFPMKNGASFHSYVSLPEGNGDLLEIYWISNTQGNKIMEIDVASFPVQNHPISCHTMPPIYGGCASQFLTLQTSNTGRFSEFLALTIINYLTYP